MAEKESGYPSIPKPTPVGSGSSSSIQPTSGGGKGPWAGTPKESNTKKGGK